MAGLPFSVMRTAQQLVQQRGVLMQVNWVVRVGADRQACFPIGHLRWRGRQSKQIKPRAANQNLRSRRPIAVQAEFSKTSFHIRVHAGLRPTGARGRLGGRQGLKGPEFPPRGVVDFRINEFLGGRSWIRRTHLDPLHEVGNHGLGQFAFRRHFQVLVPQGGQQSALVGLMRDNRRAALASREQGRFRVQSQPAPQLAFGGRFRRMARIAMRDQHRANLRFKKLQLLRRRLLGPTDRTRNATDQAGAHESTKVNEPALGDNSKGNHRRELADWAGGER